MTREELEKWLDGLSHARRSDVLLMLVGWMKANPTQSQWFWDGVAVAKGRTAKEEA